MSGGVSKRERDFIYSTLRPVCDEIMTITEADPEQTYATLPEHIKAWGDRKFNEGLSQGRQSG